MEQQVATLCLLMRNHARELLLAEKTRGFGKGKLNAPGGKPKEGDSWLGQTVAREVWEELRIVVSPEHLDEVAIIRFFFGGEFKWEVHIFVAISWSGQPQSTDEMVNPTWYNTTALPWRRMWAGDQLWLPSVLSGEDVRMDVYYSPDGETLERIVRSGGSEF